eukprot:172883-Karenia_brevis.AAC.1
MFGNLDWDAIRCSMLNEVPSLAASTAWKHKAGSEIEQSGLANYTKDRGAEQGDAAGPLEAGATQATIARKSRAALHSEQRTGVLPWLPPPGIQEDRLAAEFDERKMASQQWDSQPPATRVTADQEGNRRSHPGHEIQSGGGLVDVWYLDDGTIVCDPMLVVPFLNQFDVHSGRAGASRNRAKTYVI